MCQTPTSCTTDVARYGQGVPVPFVPEKHPGGCCKRCDKELLKDDSVIEVPEIEQPYCAPGCFNCANCKEQLCEFNYYTYVNMPAGPPAYPNACSSGG